MERLSNPRPFLKRAASGDLLRGATRSLVKRWPIERCPGWLGTLHHMQVPGNVGVNAAATATTGPNARIVFRLLAPALSLSGDVAECGVRHGRLLLSLGLFVRQRRPAKRVVGFDGFMEPDDSANDDLTLVRRVREYGLMATVKLARGDFQQSSRRHAFRRFCFVRLDRALSGLYRECFEFFYPRMTPGGVMLFDEYRDAPWARCTLAVSEFMADKAEKIDRLVTGRDVTYFVRKT
jgi:hypothetical protein